MNHAIEATFIMNNTVCVYIFLFLNNYMNEYVLLFIPKFQEENKAEEGS